MSTFLLKTHEVSICSSLCVFCTPPPSTGNLRFSPKIYRFDCTPQREKSISPLGRLPINIFALFVPVFQTYTSFVLVADGCFHFSGDTQCRRRAVVHTRCAKSTNLQFAHMLACAREFTSSGVVVYSNTREYARPSFRWLNFRPFRRAVRESPVLRVCATRRKFISHLETSPLTFMVLEQ